MAKGEIVRWITVKGRRIPIYEGESVEEAFKNRINEGKQHIKDMDDKKHEDLVKKNADKIKKGVRNALKQLDFDRPGDYAEISDRHWFKQLGISNDKMAELMSAADSRYEYEYEREEEDVKGPMKKIIHHRMYRIPK